MKQGLGCRELGLLFFPVKARLGVKALNLRHGLSCWCSAGDLLRGDFSAPQDGLQGLSQALRD